MSVSLDVDLTLPSRVLSRFYRCLRADRGSLDWLPVVPEEKRRICQILARPRFDRSDSLKAAAYSGILGWLSAVTLQIHSLYCGANPATSVTPRGAQGGDHSGGP